MITSKERIERTFSREPVDILPAGVWPWPSTLKKWVSQGHLEHNEDPYEHFGQDIRCHAGDLNSIADIEHKDVIVNETNETVITIDGNGATLRRHKLKESTPEHIEFAVKDRNGWQKLIKPHLLDVDKRRIPFEEYENDMKIAEENERYFCWHGMAPFEQMHPMCGHENLLMGMALDPAWVEDMVKTYTEFTINHLEVLFSEKGIPDGVWFSEDLGFKEKPFISPAMYKEILFPGHKRLFDWAHSKGCKVIVHSCGYVEPIVSGFIEAGMDCLQGMEVKAGMDLPTLVDKYGDYISFFGGIDVRVLTTNNYELIEQELNKKIPVVVRKGCGYILHCDHSEPPEVEYETMHYFIQKARQIACEVNVKV